MKNQDIQLLKDKAREALEALPSLLLDGRGTLFNAATVEVLPGPRGFQPSLALRYTSSTEDGPFGMGWSFPTGEVRCASRFARCFTRTTLRWLTCSTSPSRRSMGLTASRRSTRVLS